MTRWNDVSGNNNDAYQTNAVYNPTYNSSNSINFNPSVNTVGSQGMLFKKTIPPTNNLTIFAVGSTTNTHANWNTLLRGINTDHMIIVENSVEQMGYYDNNNVGYKSSGLNLSTTEPKIMSMSHNATANTTQPRVNGKNGTVLTNINEDDVDYWQAFMNWAWQGADQSFGRVSEFVAVSGTLSPTDIQKIESYLALKYGITIDQTTPTNYLATTGTMWVNDSDGYIHDIAGIGKDDCQDLHQKQSKSVNTDDPITIAIGDTIMPTNAANATSVGNDLSFLTWANNDGNTTNFSTAVSVSGVLSTARIARVWKVDKTNWNNTPNLTINFQGANASYYLLISNDPTFASGVTEYQLNAAGNRTFPASALAHGAYFTFGKRIAGPNCVNTGIVAWLRADIGANGINWTDFSGNSNDPTATSDPDATTSTLINFNPAFYYDGNDGHTLPVSTQVNGQLSILTVAKMEGTQNGRVFQSAVGNNLMGYWGGYENQLYVEGWLNGPYGTLATTDVQMFSFQRATSGAYEFRNKNKVIKTGASSNNSTWRLNIGSTATYFEPSKVYVPEVAIYSTDLSATDVSKIESYFALKYGVTLDQTTPANYLASDGTIYWDGTANSAYNDDVTGIGRDDCTNLYQKQSRSANTDDVITMAVGTSLAASNAANATTITNDKSFLVWSNNDGATAFSPIVSGFTNATTRMSRIWKVDKHNWADQNITICASQAGERYLLLSTDDTFGAGDVEKTFNFGTGCLTLNSSEMADGSYFTIATKIVGPACVNAGVQVWLRSDYGTGTTTDNTGITNWSDFSGNNQGAAQSPASPTLQPTYKNNSTDNINFNPTLRFDAGDWMENTTAPLLASNNFTLIAVTDQTAITQWGSIISYNRSGNSDRPIITNMDASATIGMNRVNVSAGGAAITTPSGPFIIRTQGNATNVIAEANGGALTSTVGGWGVGGGATIGYYLGRHNSAGYLYNGTVSEVIAYNREITLDERERVESYLALKYGITLKNGTIDYVSYDGTTEVIMWDASDNAGYHHNIAGLGREDCTDLNQKQSRSVNTGEILSLALGNSIAVSNPANTNTISTDRSFFVWGNNNGLNEFTTQVTGTNVTAVLGRVWRVDRTGTGFDGKNITLCFDNYNDDDYLVMSNSDGTFATINHEKQLSSQGCVTFPSADLPDGAYFSLGKNIMAPGCVTGGIVTWLDAQTVASGNMIDGVGWSDKSGNNKYFNNVSSDPARTDAALNYNHVITFDGNDHLSIPTITSAFTEGEVFSILRTSSNAGHAYAFGGQSNNHYRVDDNYENFGTNDRIGWRNSNNIILDGHTGLAISPNIYDPENWNLYSVWSAPNDWAASYNGYVKAQTSTNTVDFSEDATNYIGRGEADHLTGDVAEVILYRRKLTAPERRKVMSYLAIKYGITLDSTVTDQDYVAADGTIFWDWSTNNNYQHDIAGIGRDDCQKLNQKQSKSINGDDPLAIAAGNFTTFPASNEANTTTIADDESFLVWSNNNGTFTFDHTVPKFPTYFRTQRAWKIDKTSFTDQMLTISVSQTGERYLLVDEDGSGGFENDANTKEYAFDFTTGLLNINSSALPDGAVITLGTKIAGPACVNAGITGWLRADYGATIAQWTDFSGNNANFGQTVAGEQPTILSGSEQTNFNPAINFAAGDNYEKASGLLTTAGGTVVAAVRSTSVSGSNIYNQNIDDPTFGQYSGTYNLNIWDNGVHTANDIPLSFVQNQNHVATYDYGNTANSYSAHLDGRTHNLTTVAPSIESGIGYIGGENTIETWLGNIYEVAFYNRELTALELQQVHSYMALKYGITLTTNNDNDGTAFETISGSVTEGDYVASNGTTIYWDASANTGYNTNVAGIGLDICTELYQKQSKSVNTGEILTGALGSAVAASNAANTTPFANGDLSFLVWGHNNGTNDFNNTVTATGVNSMAYLGRVWRAQKTNFSNQNITLCFSGYDTDDYLLISSSATFATVTHEKVLDANGCVTFMSNDLADGAYFTLGKNLVGPACVDGGIKLWLRGDAGVTDASSVISQWDDQSGNAGHVVPAAATKEPLVFAGNATTNFNPSLTFDGSNDEMYNTTYDPLYANTNGTVFVSFKSRATGISAFIGIGANGDDPNFSVDGGAANGLRVWNDQSTPNTITSSDAYVDNESTIGAYTWTNGLNQGIEIRTNGKSFVNTTMDMRDFDPTDLFIGSADNGRFWNGELNEVVIYNRKLSAVEIQKVESYLALKYGVTINQTIPTDYIASDGSFMWEAAANSGYGNDIAGLGKDLCTGLHQKQSKSSNSDALITIALGDHPSGIPATNAANPNTITNDKSFLVWSNNNGSTSFSTLFTKSMSTINLRTARIWKVDKTNWTDQDITICVSQSGERSLIIDNGLDADFANDSETSVHALDFSTGCVTISSSLLPDGAHFSLGTEITGPACVNASVVAWYRFDYGVTQSGSNVSQIADYSGNSLNLVQNTVSRQPAYVASSLNFNPGGNFTGTENDLLNGQHNGKIVTTDPITMISVSIPSQFSGEQRTIALGNVSDEPSLGYQGTLAEFKTVGTAAANNDHSVALTVNTPYIIMGTANNQTPKDVKVSYNGLANEQSFPATPSGDGTFNAGANASGYIGLGNEANSTPDGHRGIITEAVVYNRVITTVEKQRIYSYLALKYGITLDQSVATDYVASNWDGTTGTKMWDATMNATYKFNIAGIGRDSCTNLLQKQSKSVNTGEFLTVALGSTIQTSNALNTSTITADRSFLVWGHNNGATDFLSNAGGTNATARMSRVWKVQKTNWTNQNITMKFDGYDDESYLIIHNTDPTFATTPLEYQLSVNGEVTFNTSDLPDGAFFTLGKNLLGPACVNGGIKVWLRADDGSATGAAWNDYSNNEHHFTQVNAGLQAVGNTNSINFNPGLTFTNDEIVATVNTTNMSLVSSDFEIIAVGKTALTNTNIQFPYASTVNGHFEGHVNNGVGFRFHPNNNFTDIGANGAYSNTIPHIFGGKVEGNVGLPHVNGKLGATPLANARSSAVAFLQLGRRADDTFAWSGDISEYIVYNRALAAVERQKVQSYLALKYGITLDMSVTNQDYIASDSTNIWDWSDNSGYRNDVAGIGRDDCNNLHQKQSKSVNSDAIVSAYVGNTTSTDNASNPNNVTNDKSFFTWGNDNQATTLDVPISLTGSSIQARMLRQWKVDKTNWQDQNITMCFGQAGERFLLVDEGGDGDFLDDSETKTYGLNFATGCITINTDKFPDGSHFTIGTKLVAPACVQESNISAWWKADYNATGASWSDFSGNGKNATQTNPLYQGSLVTSALNFNPALDFDGTDDHLLMDIDDIRSSNYSYFAVGFREDNSLNYILGTPGGSANVDLHFGYNSNTVLRLGQFSNDLDLTVPAFDNPADTIPYLHFGRLDQSVGHLIQERRNGTRYNATNTNTTPLSGTTQEYIGRYSTNYYNGKMAEVIVYREALTDAEARQVMSYLGIKYGLTLEVFSPATTYDYTTSTGSNIWSAVNNYDYRFNIAGIGRDSCTELYQKQSRSTNSGSIVTMALGAAVETTNDANTSTLTDLSFLVWGHNNGSLDYNETVSGGTYVTSRLGRVWRLDKTNFSDDEQDITICFDGYDDTNYFLVSNTSATFATLNVETPLDANGCVTISTFNLPDGAYFTLGKIFFGPACVAGGIKLWMRADDGTLVGSNLTNWQDQSNNNNDATTVSSDPSLAAGSASSNYNPVVNFDGTDGLRGNFASAITSNDLTVVTVAKLNTATVSNGRIISGAQSASNDNDNFSSFNMSRFTTGNSINWDRSTDLNSTGTYVNNGFHLFTGIAGNDGGNTKIRANGLQTATSSFPAGAFNLQRFGIGEAAQGGTFLNGDVAEVAIYSKELTGTDLDKVESYFALKYGISLNQSTDRNYIASNGDAMWTNDADGFENDISGLGRDSCTSLYQKQARSINADDIITIALGDSIATTNAEITKTLVDRSFFVWASNNGATNAFDYVVTGTAIADRRIERIWKVDKTANWTNQDITICFDGQIGERYIIVDTDPAFGSVDQEIALDFLTGCVTLNTSNFPHNSYFSLATNLLGPGCADNIDILLWLRGDYNATASQWNDFSGNARNASQIMFSNQPATGGLINYNPAMVFGNDDYFEITNLNINSNETDRDPITAFIIYEATETDEPIWGNENGGVDRYLYTNQVSGGVSSPTYTGGNTTNKPTLVATIMDDTDVSGTTSGSQVYVDGGTAQSFTHSSANGGLSSTILGDDSGTGGDMFTGKIAEFAVYRGALTATERRQAESYFALKYGISLGVPTPIAANNYIASNGSSMWSAVDNFAYRFDIAGIGRDDCAALEQKQSRSANSDYEVRIALGTSFPASNALNTSTLPNMSFFVWGNNDGAMEFNSAVSGTVVTARLDRVWKVDRTDWIDQDVTICFDNYDERSYLIISDASATFATVDFEMPLDVNGCITISSLEFMEGAYFTLGQDLKGPACVNTEIQFWLRSDEGTDLVTDGSPVSMWDDYSGKTNHASSSGAARPTYESDAANLMNFHPILNFDGTDDHFENLTAPLLNSTDFTLFAVTDIGTYNNDRGIVSYNRSTNTTRPVIGTTGTTPNIGINSVGISNYGPSVSTTSLPGAFLMRTQGDASDVFTSANGATGGSLYATTAGWGPGTGAANGYFVGRRNNAGGYYNGRIAEVVAYSRSLAAFEIEKVESYLAVKYGLTLDQTTERDYVASDWDGAAGTIFWDASNNGAYKHDITGIGQDTCTDLNQKQSKSANSDDILTIGLDGIAADNASNAAVFDDDRVFLMWANDNGGITQVNTDLPAALATNSFRVEREWKIDKTGTVDSVVVRADLSSLSLSSPADEISVLIDRDGDGDFTTGTIDVVDAVTFSSGIATFGKIVFEDGDVFTIATELPLANLQIKVFLQGPYNTGTHQMNTTLASLDLLPATDPYGLGVTPVNTDPNDIPNVVDWVKIEIRDGATPTTIVKEIAAYVTADGTVVDTAGNSTIALGMIAGDYKVAIRHRNHLGIMTNNNVVFGGPTALATVDFTMTSPSHGVYGTDARKEIEPAVWAMWGGNASGNLNVRYSGASNDPLTILTVLGGSTSNVLSGVYHNSDVNMNGIVRYSGAGNEPNFILTNVLGGITSKVIVQQLP
ncbi:MAG: LamG-like jellyroll fold domain-containing protein [Saprospiraceae bacterium]|nr:LamG-like jellyroll fold domain-containing protein [Saprospiraceae bacterium]